MLGMSVRKVRVVTAFLTVDGRVQSHLGLGRGGQCMFCVTVWFRQRESLGALGTFLEQLHQRSS